MIIVRPNPAMFRSIKYITDTSSDAEDCVSLPKHTPCRGIGQDMGTDAEILKQCRSFQNILVGLAREQEIDVNLMIGTYESHICGCLFSIPILFSTHSPVASPTKTPQPNWSRTDSIHLPT